MKKPTKTNAGRRAPPAELLDEMRGDASVEASEDKLEAIRNKMRVLRDIQFDLKNLEERRKHLSERKKQITDKELVDLMDEAKISSMTLQPEGNMPEFKVEVGPYYHANIDTEWPEDKRQKAFSWIKRYHPGMLRNTIVITCGKNTMAAQKKILALAAKLKLPAVNEYGVPWNTLTAFVREQIEDYERMPPLELLGATVGRVAKIKKQKEK